LPRTRPKQGKSKQKPGTSSIQNCDPVNVIYIIGVNHELQYFDGSTNLLLNFLSEQVELLGAKLIAEELNQEAIDREQQTRQTTLESTSRGAASKKGIDHRFCDPDSAERVVIGIPSPAQIRKSLGLRAGENEDRVEEEARRDFPLREKFWLDKISDKIHENIIFVCGSCHVDSFAALLEQRDYQCIILHKNWAKESQLDDILSNGIVVDLYEAESGNMLAEFIGRNADVLNDSFSHLFGDIQRILTAWIFLALARLYEQRSPKSVYPIRTIPEALKILKQANIFIKDKSKTISNLPVEDSEKEHLKQAEDALALKWIAEYFQDRLEKLKEAIDKVKEKRDKILAHREAIHEMGLKTPRWNEIDELISFAKTFYEVVGEGIVGRSVGSDPHLLSRSLKRLLEQAGIKPK
jgi:predicted metal-binding protein